MENVYNYIRGINGINMTVKGNLLRMASLGSLWQIDRILNMQGSAWHESDPAANVKDAIHKMWDVKTV